LDEIPEWFSKFGIYGLKIESIILECIDDKLQKKSIKMPSLLLAFQRPDLKVFMELDKFSLDKIRQIRDYLSADVMYWDVSSNEIGTTHDRRELNSIEREGHKITIVCGLCDIITQFTPAVKTMILDECIKIVGTA
jgi:hypothetical protein